MPVAMPRRLRRCRARASLITTLLTLALDQLDELVPAVAVFACESNELLHLGQDCAPVGRADDGDPAAAPELQEPLVAQDAQRAEHGVAVHAENGGEVHRGRKPLAR